MAALTGLEYIKGTPIDVQASKGKKVIVVEFWATWCPPCRSSIPHLSELQHKYKSQNVEFIGITNEENMQTVKKFVDSMGANMDYAVAVDVEGEVYSNYMTKYHVSGIPHAFVLDKDSKIAWHGHPMEPQFEQTIQQAVLDLAKASYVPEPVPQSRHELEGMSVGQLKKILGSYNVGYTDCIEKSELIDRIETSIMKK
jgi:thiol-disulfide isomerase/thioredoxin